MNKDGFKPNLETHLIPLLASKLEETSLESKDKSTTMSSKDNHHPLLMQVPPIVSYNFLGLKICFFFVCNFNPL